MTTTPAAPRRPQGTLPLSQYAAIGDGRSVALVGSDGSVDWWCVPDLDSTPLFDRLLDATSGGRFSLSPDEAFTVERGYRPDSNVLETVFTTASGRARVTDSLNSGISGRLPWSELARRVEGLDGEMTFAVVVRPGARHGRGTPWREPAPDGDVLHLDGLVTAVRGSPDIDRTVEDDGGVEARLTTRPGSRSTIALLAAARHPLILPAIDTIDARIDRSDQSWREWAEALAYRGPYAAQVRRSALALKLLLFSPTGAIAAAATTSLPERVGGGKNYDYRYAWIRDVAYSIKAFLRVGAIEEATAAFAWLMATIRRHGGRLHTMYRLNGDLAPGEHDIDIPGYGDSRPVRVGNRARDQLQLGVFGDILETAALFVERGHVLDLVTKRQLGDLADRCADVWHQPDSGMWELEPVEHHAMSKIGCWTALDRAVDLAGRGQIETTHAARWTRERDRIGAWLDRECWSDERGAYLMSPGSPRLDASLLLATRFGFDRRDRLAATRDAIRRELSDGPHVFRYSGMRDEEGAFLACGFWMVEAFALLGERDAAIEQMDGMLAACDTMLGVLTEQIDPATGAMLGNVPQALSHLAMVHAACAIADAE